MTGLVLDTFKSIGSEAICVRADLTKKLNESLATLRITLSSDRKPNLLL